VPLDWAMTQNNLGTALQTLGARETGTERLEQAVAADREALQEHARERVPLGWVRTQNNLGTALRSLGERESGTAQLERAVAAYQAALSVFELAGATYYIEVAKGNMALVHAVLNERLAQPEPVVKTGPQRQRN
jgi:tetratricopeptide (TPR) repeat protein